MQPMSALKTSLILLLAMHVAGCYSHLNQQAPVAAEPTPKVMKSERHINWQKTLTLVPHIL